MHTYARFRRDGLYQCVCTTNPANTSTHRCTQRTCSVKSTVHLSESAVWSGRLTVGFWPGVVTGDGQFASRFSRSTLAPLNDGSRRSIQHPKDSDVGAGLTDGCGPRRRTRLDIHKALSVPLNALQAVADGMLRLRRRQGTCIPGVAPAQQHFAVFRRSLPSKNSEEPRPR
jgi:hypothetical protein